MNSGADESVSGVTSHLSFWMQIKHISMEFTRKKDEINVTKKIAFFLFQPHFFLSLV